MAAGTVPRVRQVAFLVTRAHKPLALGRVLDMESPTSAIVFCRTRLEVDGLVETLNAHGYRAEALHGGMVQKQRDRVMAQFRAAKTDLLVATDVAARGLDIAHLSHVVNYDVPSSPEVYVHRIGRTGRVGRAGVAITLAEPREHRQLRNIEAFTRQKIEVTSVPTVADLRSRRLDVTRAALRERLLAGGFEDVRVVVESLAQEFDLVEIASAAVKMALVLEEGEGGRSEEEIPVVSLKSDAPRPEGRKGPHPRDAKGPRPTHDTRKMAPGVPKAGGKTTRLYIAAGRQAGVRPADLVGAIAGEAGVGSHVIGSIEIGDRFSIVEVPTALATRILFALRATKIRGRKVTVNRNRGDQRVREPGPSSRAMPDEPEPPDGDGAAERLAKYRAKRSADRTPEPFGGEEATVSPEATAALPVEPPPAPPGPARASSASRSTRRRACTTTSASRSAGSCAPGRCRAVPRSTPTTSAWRSRWRTTRSSTPTSRARSPRATTGRARSSSGTRGCGSRSRTPRRRCRRASSPSSCAATSCAAPGTSSGPRARARARAPRRSGCS